MEIILTHNNADFDAVASLLGAYKLHPEAIAILPKKAQSNVREFLSLYQSAFPFVHWDDFKDGEAVTKVTITDTSRRLDMRDLRDDVPTMIIDHHELKRDLLPHETWAGEILGAITTLLVERIREQKIKLTSLEATLFALGIYTDTGSFTYGGTSSRDIRAVAWLLEQGAVLDTVRRFMTKPLNIEQQALLEQLMDSIDSRSIHGYDLSVCTATSDKIIDNINTVVRVLRDILDVSALIVLVAMPEHVQLIARSTTDAINVGQLAEYFDGGGHPRASASAIPKLSLQAIHERVWQFLNQHIQPAIRVANLMSFGEVQTVSADDKISEIITPLRRIGHEGYPVLENNKVVGLLTMRSADKALEHGLKQSTVREVMNSGSITLNPDDSVNTLEEIMVSSQWGQIPVLDNTGKLIGIVTRTDLIRYWGQTHPTVAIEIPKINPVEASQTLGEANIRLVEFIADFAQSKKMYLYMVGGIVRDLLLKRPNFDIDFVLEGNAIDFAEALQAKYGGEIQSYPPFGTATWTLTEDVAEKLGLSLSDIPHHLDFATARSELYEHPTALPTVYNSGIKLDLRRRDFTINSMAVQLSPVRAMWQILDFYGGLSDLDNGLIRVLHSLSFVDDPTRILRAVRFANRLNFEIEARTKDLIQSALPMLKRVTGERLQNELTLILNDDSPADALIQLEQLNILQSIHPQFQIPNNIRDVFDLLAQKKYPQWGQESDLLRWHILMATVNHEAIEAILEELLFAQNKISSIKKSAEILQDASEVIYDDAKPSVIFKRLKPLTDEALMTVWLLADTALARQRIKTFYMSWRHIKPISDGNTLKQMGLKPSPIFREILERLQDAWLDGEVHDEEQEKVLLAKLVAEADNENTN